MIRSVTVFRDLDKRLAAEKELLCRSEALRQDLFEVSVRGVADGEPWNLGRRTKLLEQENEIAVLGQYNGARLPSGEENLAVSGVTQTKIAHRFCIDFEL